MAKKVMTAMFDLHPGKEFVILIYISLVGDLLWQIDQTVTKITHASQ